MFFRLEWNKKMVSALHEGRLRDAIRAAPGQGSFTCKRAVHRLKCFNEQRLK